MAVAQSTLVLRQQAADGLAQTKAALAAAGLGFTADDLAVIAAAPQKYPIPEEYTPGHASPETMAAVQDVAKRATEAEYPPNGYATDDPRLAPVEGLSIYVAAMAAKAIGFGSEDAAYVERVTRALGFDPATYLRAAAVWRERVVADVVLATFYGQVFAQA
jgi:hypothetical protein